MMTNERAIHLLHRLQDEQFDGIHGDERREALSMAMRALEGDGDTIYRQQAIDAVSKWLYDVFGITESDGTATIFKRLRELPSAQPELSERKKGKWINHRNDDGHNIADCDQCGNAIQWFDGDEIPRYCCMCGADMRGESE